MSKHSDNQCPLCGGADLSQYFEDNHRVYLSCANCRLVSVPGQYYLTLADEKKEYDLHINDPADPGYQRFLSRLSRPLLARLAPGQTGLDFGCGPGPALHRLVQAQGHRVYLYDPFYARDTTVFLKSYDFIMATEVVEHLHHPGQVFDRLFGLLRCGGWLGIMTKLIRDQAAFARWHYIRDLTHVCFYHWQTFAYLSEKHTAALVFADDDVILMQKKTLESGDTRGRDRAQPGPYPGTGSRREQEDPSGDCRFSQPARV